MHRRLNGAAAAGRAASSPRRMRGPNLGSRCRRLAQGAVARGLRDRGKLRRAGAWTLQRRPRDGRRHRTGAIACDQVVMAGGAWSSLFVRAHGVTIPQLSVLASVAATEPMPEIFPGNAADDRFAFRRRVDGGYSIAPGAEHDFFIGPDAFRNFGVYLPVLKKDFRSTHFRAACPCGVSRCMAHARGTGRPIGPGPFEAMRVLNPAPEHGHAGPHAGCLCRAPFPALAARSLRAAWGGHDRHHARCGAGDGPVAAIARPDPSPPG